MFVTHRSLRDFARVSNSHFVISSHVLLPHYSFVSRRSLRDFGLGKSSIAEGGLGLFTLAGGLVTLGLLAWVKGTALRKGRPYQATLEFPLACGITVGTPVSHEVVTGAEQGRDSCGLRQTQTAL